MAETESPHEPAFSGKRKPDLTSQDLEDLPLKSQKLQTQDHTIQPKEGNHSLENQTLEAAGKNDSSVPEFVPEKEESGIDAEEEEEEEAEEDEDDDFEDEDNDHDEEEDGNAAVDRKGKGVLIEEEKDSDDDDDSDDSSDGGNESDGESDLSDDPLAEVDLDNILPSRTRRRVVQPGVYIAKDDGNNAEGADSDDSDA
ncbi:hypothetical protein DITRI_Ditri09bG0003000 [Diplodiscus trichospermus]